MNELLYLSKKDVERLDIPMVDVITAVERMFDLKGNGKTEMPPKQGIHTRENAFIHAMPAYMMGEREAAGLKWVSGYPENPSKGLPYISGLFILNDTETGLPLSVMDCVWITAMRTGAATAVSAKRVARKGSSKVGIIGCGVQARSNLLALNEVFDLKKVFIFDKFEDAMNAFQRDMSEKVDAEIIKASEPKKAVSGMDIVVTAGPWMKKPLSVALPGWLDKGACAYPVDMDTYWSPEAVADADDFYVDDIEQYRHFREIGCFKGYPEPKADLGHIVSGNGWSRPEGERTVVEVNIGMALDDVAVASLIYEKAVAEGAGVKLPL